MIWSGESSVAHVTFKGFGSSVFSEVSGEFIRSAKLPPTSFPTTLIGFFSCMCSHMSFQMTAFGIHLSIEYSIVFFFSRFRMYLLYHIQNEYTCAFSCFCTNLSAFVASVDHYQFFHLLNFHQYYYRQAGS